MMRSGCVAAALAMLWAAPTLGTTLARTSLDDLIRQSTAIVRGKVVGTRTALRGTMIYTHVRVQVLERWKGPDDSTVEVALPGGTMGGVRQSIGGVPELAEGAEYVFFLWTGRSRVTYLLGLSQGVLDIARTAQGEPLVYRGSIDAVIVDPKSGSVVRDEPFSMRMSEFTSRVRTALGGGTSR